MRFLPPKTHGPKRLGVIQLDSLRDVSFHPTEKRCEVAFYEFRETSSK
jgi:hypothetical protein